MAITILGIDLKIINIQQVFITSLVFFFIFIIKLCFIEIYFFKFPDFFTNILEYSEKNGKYTDYI